MRTGLDLGGGFRAPTAGGKNAQNFFRSRPGLSIILAALFTVSGAANVTATTLPAGFTETIVFSGLNAPTAVRFASDGRVFVAEKGGLLKVFDSLTDPTPAIVADLRPAAYDFNDGGLLGLAIHPQFPAQPYVYILYTLDAPIGVTTPYWNDGCPTASTTGCAVGGRLSRLTLDANGIAGPEEIFIENWCQQYAAHSIGDLAFGPDGALYVTSGEGGNAGRVDYGQGVNDCGDPINEGGALHAQDIRSSGDPVTYAGALLRLDPMTGAAMPDNPLVGGADAGDDRIIAYGLRNPFRFTVHPTTGEIWIGDVGWQTWEEINRVPNPQDAVVENFGWPCYEGPVVQPGYDAADLPLCESLYAANNATPPFLAQQHSGSAAYSGLVFYTGGNYPAFWHGALFYTDYTRRWIRALRPTAGGLPNTNFTAFAGATPPIVDLQIGPGGDLFFADVHGGTIRRISYTAGNQAPVAVADASPRNGPAPLLVHFTSAGSFDPDAGDSISFSWDLDGDGACDDAAVANPVYQYGAAGDYLAMLCVTDNHGAVTTATVAIQAGNAPPVATIVQPTPGTLWRVDQVIDFSGYATDPDSGPMPPEALCWELTLHHCHHDDPLDCHVHFAETFTGVDAGSFVGIDHEAPAYLTLSLIATEPPPDDWWDTAWSERSKLHLDDSGLTAPLVNVPVLVRLDAARMAYPRAQANGADLRFVDALGTQLAHEIESWDSVLGSVVWVRVPVIDPALPDNYIWMYYGNTDASDAQAPALVWDQTYAAVWHLNPTLADSTVNANDGVNQGSGPAAGYIKEARSFDGIDDYIDAGLSAALNPGTSLSIEAWIQTASTTQNKYLRVLSNREMFPQTGGYRLEYNPGLDTVIFVTSSGDSATGTAALNTNWHHVTAVVDETHAAIYVDGVDVTTDGIVTPIEPSAVPFFIGWRTGGGDAFAGNIDEVRVSNVARSPAWVSMQYRAMTDQLITFGARESFVPLSTTAALRLDPETIDLEFASMPPGLQLVVYAGNEATPFHRDMIVGARTTVVAPTPQLFNGTTWYFDRWSDGGAATHDLIVTDQPQTLTATFLQTPVGDCSLDGRVDLDDPPYFGVCITGPSIIPIPQECFCADLDGDGDVDMRDFAGVTVLVDSP